MSFRTLIIAALLSGAVFVIGCKSNSPVMNVPNTQFSANSKPDLARVKKAIVLGGTRSGWQMQPVADGHILATILNSGHIAKVDIRYSTDSYSITYKDSSKFIYDGTTISPTYNHWVDKLHSHIRKELSRL